MAEWISFNCFYQTQQLHILLRLMLLLVCVWPPYFFRVIPLLTVCQM